MMPGLGIEPGTPWWKASVLTTAPTLLPDNPDVLADKPHPRFDTKVLSKKVQLIRWCLWYIAYFACVCMRDSDCTIDSYKYYM